MYVKHQCEKINKNKTDSDKIRYYVHRNLNSATVGDFYIGTISFILHLFTSSY